jgi:hypothetical protein
VPYTPQNPNHLQITRVGNVYSFYCNNVLVWQQTIPTLDGMDLYWGVGNEISSGPSGITAQTAVDNIQVLALAPVVVTNTDVVVTCGPIPVSLNAWLSDRTSQSITGLLFASVSWVGGIDSGRVADVLGTTSILGVSTGVLNQAGTTNTFTVELSTNVFMLSDTPIDLGHGWFVEALGERAVFGPGPGGMSNSVWIANGWVGNTHHGGSFGEPDGQEWMNSSRHGESGSSTNAIITIGGIWEDGVTSFTGKICNTEKPRW